MFISNTFAGKFNFENIGRFKISIYYNKTVPASDVCNKTKLNELLEF